MKKNQEITIVGTLRQNPEMEIIDGGKTITKFTLTDSEKWQDNSVARKQDKNDSYQILAYGKLANDAMKNLKQGSKVYLKGKVSKAKTQGFFFKSHFATELELRDMDDVLLLLQDKPKTEIIELSNNYEELWALLWRSSVTLFIYLAVLYGVLSTFSYLNSQAMYTAFFMAIMLAFLTWITIPVIDEE